LGSLLQERALKKGEILITEGEPLTGLFIVSAGELQVTVHQGLEEVPLAVVAEGAVLGEVGFLTGQPPTATVTAISPGRVLVLPRAHWSALRDKTEAYSSLVEVFSQRLARRLVQQNTVSAVALTDEQRLRRGQKAAGLLIVRVALLFSAYSILLPVAAALLGHGGGWAWSTSALLLVFAASIGFGVHRSEYPGTVFGLTLGDWRKHLKEALMVSTAMGAVVLLGKMALVYGDVLGSDPPVFRLSALLRANPSVTDLLAQGLAYALLVPIEELIVRGGIQSGLQSFLIGAKRVPLAILVSTVMLAAVHVHMFGPLVALLLLLPGLLWGLLFARQQSLLGVTVSHLLVGWFALFVVGFGG
jgi:CRP-like cAMP-binding protein